MKTTNVSRKIKDAAPYVIDRREVVYLSGALTLPIEIRRKYLEKLVQERGQAYVIDLFAQFMGMAKSVEDNTRELVEMYLIVECDHYPHTAEKINLPTLQGALNGVLCAIPPTRGMCSGCAFRLGSQANQSPITSIDAKDSSEGNFEFWCHEKLDAEGKPAKKCAGWGRIVPRIPSTENAELDGLGTRSIASTEIETQENKAGEL